jgi:hypothetical protein
LGAAGGEITSFCVLSATELEGFSFVVEATLAMGDRVLDSVAVWWRGAFF